MNRTTTSIAVVLAGMLVLSALAPVGAAVSQDTDDLSVSVSNPADPVVTVTANDTPADNATVDVSLADDAGDDDNESDDEDDESDDGDEEESDDNESTDAEPAAGDESDDGDEADGGDDTESDDDDEADDDDEDESDDEDADDGDDEADDDGEDDVSYAGVGTYTTDENGTVDLPAPSEEVTIVVTATVENTSVSTTVEIGADESENAFGQLLSQFIHDNKDDVDGPFGLAVANFIFEHGPGNAPDHAGPSGDAGPPSDGDQGPPDHAGPPDDADDGDDEDADDEDETDDETGDDDGQDDDAGNGPPDRAGP
ncbi:hypothetical protein [Halovivax limisalsi]|uniref:hypothetical protein n=1 Tax=Halovivax limisalsi TaxID=1453760 RepID=UPI001FFD6CC9|nr:hypothetical protein [Halovivax limisalsi]